jgi:NAD+ kinase
MHFMRIALLSKDNDPKLHKYIDELSVLLNEIGAKVDIIDSTLTFNNLPESKISNFNTSKQLHELKLVIVIGGDGTLLSCARKVVDYDIPIIGINQGKLGFMTDIAIHDMLTSIKDVVLYGHYNIELRSLLNATIISSNDIPNTRIALNDVVVSRGPIGNMIEFDISINDQFVLSQKSDGIIFSTPTGSTAYSLAAGGSILHPGTNVFSIVPICPQSMSNRPLVIGDTVTIDFTLTGETMAQVHFDGQECLDLNTWNKVILRKHHKPFRLLHPHKYNYYETLRKKLHWSKRVS